MNLRAVLVLEYPSAEKARAIERALGPDNEGFVKTEVDGSTLRAVVEGGTPEALRHTLDDLLACLRVAEEAVGVDGGGVPGEEE